MKRSTNTLYALLILIMALTFGSCSVPKNISYFEDFNTTMEIEANNRLQIRVKPEDQLQIVVSSKDPQLAALFNLPIVSSRLGDNRTTYNGVNTPYNPVSVTEKICNYTVDPEGNIDFPVLGKLHIAGMTRSEVSGFIKGELMGRDLMKDPRVTVEFLNTGISVLGEVKSPGRFLMNRDEVTILDALSMAGDMTIQGQRDNVRVLRKNGDTTQVYILDLTNGKELFNSPAYYLQQDDIVYVEPNNFRKRQTTVNGNSSLSASFWMSVVSVLSSVAVVIVSITR